MLYRIRRFGIAQTSKIAGVIYFMLGIVLTPFFYLAMNAPPAAGEAARPEAHLPPAVLVLVPFLYGLFGYVMTAFILYIYNRTAKSIGGVELDIVYAVAPPEQDEAPVAPNP